jgi:hypothetical protein
VRRYEVWQLKLVQGQKSPDLVMILQSEKLDHLASIIVAPLEQNRMDIVVPNLTPSIDINDTSYTILIPLMTAIDKRDFDFRLTESSTDGYEIDRAIDRLFFGI